MAIQGKSGQQLVRFNEYIDDQRQGKPLVSFLKGFAGGLIFMSNGTEFQAQPESQNASEDQGKLFEDPDA